ncbi:MAG: VWA domain-containing protein [Lachnospiraceae bacterium]|nr:VWA domain-containing protein [Lachnospiraceae bacterium]
MKRSTVFTVGLRFFEKRKAALAVALAAVLLVGCGSSGGGSKGNGKDDVVSVKNDYALSYDDAVEEVRTLADAVKPATLTPQLDLDAEDLASDAALADIDTFEMPVKGDGDINIEIAAATELSSSAPDDWLNIVAQNFNKSGQTVNDKRVSVSIRKMASGEVLTYMVDGGYRPQAFIPSNFAWGKMLDASGINTIEICKRIAGNTAGILMSDEIYDTYTEKYGDVTVSGVLEAAIAGDLVFAYTNPYTSSTGLNILTAMLYAFDSDNPLSQMATQKLIEYQQNAPTAAYTTGVLRNSAKKGIIDAMVMEEQAYINTPELKSYVYAPAGIRHDHPVYTFDYVSDEEQEAARAFADYCLTDENQKLAADRGFNRHEDYEGQDTGLDGAGYLAAQDVWKTNKNGGRPIIAVFVTDISGSMNGLPLNTLKESLIASAKYIGSDNYVGLVSYSDDVFINLPIDKFGNKQRAYFSGAVKGLNANGSTATYDATVVGLKMLLDKAEEVPDASMMLFVLSDGEQNAGYKFARIKPIVAGLQIPVYCIGYNMSETEELKELSEINEATLINADSDDIVNQLRNLFNVNM